MGIGQPVRQADVHFQHIAMLLSNDRLLKPEARQRAQIALKQVQAGKPAVDSWLGQCYNL